MVHLYTCKYAKRAGISHHAVSRLSHIVEVEYNRWIYHKVQDLNKHGKFRAPSCFFSLVPGSTQYVLHIRAPSPASTEVVTQSSSLWGGALRDETNKRAISSRASGFFGVSFTCRETEPRKNLRRSEIRLRFASNKFRRWYLINSF